jgi:hypothetical protein
MVTSLEHLDARLSSMEKILTEIKGENDDATMEEAERILILGRKRIYAIQEKFTIKKQGRRLIFSRKELLDYFNSNIKNRK